MNYEAIDNSISNEIGIMALGNLLHSDKNVEIHTLNHIRQILPPEIELIDGDTPGMYLLNFLENKTHLIILDSIDSYKLSLAEVIYWVHFIGAVPKEIVVIGVQMPTDIEKVMDCLKGWGVQEKMLN